MKKEHYGNLEPKKVVRTTEHFGSQVKPFLSNESIKTEKIILVEKEEILTNDRSVANNLNNFFSDIVTRL